jgi:hypothetical protein
MRTRRSRKLSIEFVGVGLWGDCVEGGIGCVGEDDAVG